MVLHQRKPFDQVVLVRHIRKVMVGAAHEIAKNGELEAAGMGERFGA
jgi:hypothetical protein